MIKALTTGRDGKPLLLLGLSTESWQKLTAGFPIRVRGADLGIANLNVLLIAGKTETDLVDVLEGARLLPPDVAEKMRAGYQLMKDVPATRGDAMVWDSRAADEPPAGS